MSRANLNNKKLNQVFISWRNQGYKSAYDRRLKSTFHSDLSLLEIEYKSIVLGLQEKIRQTEELTRTKKAAEQEFSYSI